MGYKALVTLDLPGATSEQRQKFYEILIEENWCKIPHLDTAWKISFFENVIRTGAITTIKSDIQKAKDKSNVKRIDYAIQLDTNEITINFLN